MTKFREIFQILALLNAVGE